LEMLRAGGPLVPPVNVAMRLQARIARQAYKMKDPQYEAMTRALRGVKDRRQSPIVEASAAKDESVDFGSLFDS
jgi:hypothetical protein